eukprot:scaffold175916_cov27-Tisochrysis_lutea.AAC.1
MERVKDCVSSMESVSACIKLEVSSKERVGELASSMEHSLHVSSLVSSKERVKDYVLTQAA